MLLLMRKNKAEIDLLFLKIKPTKLLMKEKPEESVLASG